MTEEEIKGFIDTVTSYFSQVTGIPAKMGLPYIKDSQTVTQDFTGVIGISGSRKGGIYFTAGKELLIEISSFILGDEEVDSETLYDLIGEVINTISGNMREVFGSSFNISVPIVLKGSIEDIVIQLRPPVFIIPIKWNNHTCHLGIGLE